MKITLLIIPFLFAGCGQPVTQNKVTFKHLKCLSDGDVGIKLIKGFYECVEGKNRRISIISTKKKYIKSVKSNSECETTITEIFNSKEFKKPLVVCKGKILQHGQKTRVVRVSK